MVYVDTEGKSHEQPARVVAVCNNAAYVARLLLLSKSDRFPRGLTNSSGLVGMSDARAAGKITAMQSDTTDSARR